MAFTVQISTESQAIQDFNGGNGGSNYLNRTGMFEDITINFASVEATAGGAYKLNLNVTYGDNEMPLYGPTIQNKDGKPNTIGMQILNKLCAIAGIDSGKLSTVKEVHTVGKDKKEQEFEVFEELSGLVISMNLQKEWGINPNKKTLSQTMNILNVFRNKDKATANEIVNGTEAGTQYALEKEKYADTSKDFDKYKDGLTKETVAKMLEDEKASKSGGTTTATAQSPKGKLF